MRKATHEHILQTMQQLVATLHQQLAERNEEIERLHEQLAEKDRFWLDRVREVEDWGRANSLDQLRGMHPTAAMEAQVPEPPRRLYRHDPTGIITDEVDPREYLAES